MSRRVAVAVLHHGDRRLTEACLRSTLALEPPPAVRLVVWNEPLPEGAILPADLAARIEVVPAGANRGYTGGANLAARAAADRGAEWLWFLNNDTVVAPDALAILLGAAAEPRVALVGPRIISAVDGRIWHDGGEILWPEGRPSAGGHGEPVAPGGDPRPVGFVCGCAPLIRLAPFLAVGGFDERYFLHYEDADLSLRLVAEGHRLLHASRAEVRHIGGATTGEGSPESRYYRLRNRRLLRDRHAPDRAAAERAARIEERRERRRALRYSLVGRRAEARAIRDALADHAEGRSGRRGSARDGANAAPPARRASPLLRPVRAEDPRELEALLALNRANVPAVGEIPLERLARFAGIAAEFPVIDDAGEPIAFLIALEPHADYDSPNFIWFRERRDRFLYVDRLAVAAGHRRRGLGRRLYEHIFERARARGIPRVVCEVNLEPLNQASLDFHAALGFREVGRAHAKGHLVAYLERP